MPPNKPVIYTGVSRSLAKILQPFNEGSEMSLLCEVIGGSPPPRVTWYFEGKVLDDTYTQEHEDITINRLDVSKVTRDFLRARLVCKANNTQLMTPLTSEIILDVNRKCVEIRIVFWGVSPSPRSSHTLSDHYFWIESLDLSLRLVTNFLIGENDRDLRRFGRSLDLVRDICHQES